MVVIEVHQLSIIGFHLDGIGKDLILDIISKGTYRLLHLLVRSDTHLYAVSNLKAALLTDILYTVDQLTSCSLVHQIVSKLYLQGYGQVALVGHKPSWDILTDNLHIFEHNHLFLSTFRYVECNLSLSFQLSNLLL